MTRFVKEHWERMVFSLIGLCFVSFSIYFLWVDKLSEAIAAFGMFFISFVLSSLSRFKKFKGLGIEAELWEDKKKEAAILIESLKNVVTIYSKEILMTRARSGRMADHSGWESHWKLYDELTSRHKELGYTIDFSEERAYLEALFIFDIVMHISEDFTQPIQDGKSAAHKFLSDKFGSPVTDNEGFRLQSKILGDIQLRVKDPFKISRESNLAQKTIDLVMASKQQLKDHFDVDIQLDQNNLDTLNDIAKQVNTGKLTISDKLIKLANPKQ